MPIDRNDRPPAAFLFTEMTGESHRSLQLIIVQVLLDDLQIDVVPAGKAGTAETYFYLRCSHLTIIDFNLQR